MGKIAAIVLAAGQGKRMNNTVHKQYLLLEGRPVLYYSLAAFERSGVDEVVLVTGRGEVPYCEQEIVGKYGFHKVVCITEGGAERCHSVYEGLKALSDDTEYVLIHDGARPLVTERIIADTLEAVKEYNACIVGMPVKDTIKIIDDNQYAAQTPDRNSVWAVQTPQAFSYEIVWKAYTALMANEIPVTDDAMVVETFLHYPVKLIKGSYENMKITTPEDLIIAEAFLKREGLSLSDGRFPAGMSAYPASDR